MPIEGNRRTVGSQHLYPNQAQQVRQEQNNVNVTNPQNTIQQVNVVVSPEIYRQYAISNPPAITVERVNNGCEELMQQVYELDRQVFADQDPYENYNDFINFVRRNQLSTYVVRDENDNGSILGYYQLEPVKDGDLYIDSIRLKPEYRNSRKGYQAIKKSWNNILNYARENGAETLSLPVQAGNRNLLRMYQSLGFTISETLPDYYGQNADAYFMTRTVDNQAGTITTIIQPAEEDTVQTQTPIAAEEENQTVQTVIEEPAAEEIPTTEVPAVENTTSNTITAEVQTAETEVSELEADAATEPSNETETAEVLTPAVLSTEKAKSKPEISPEMRLFNQKMEQAKAELLEMGVPEVDLSLYLNYCDEYYINQKNHAFNDDLFACSKYKFRYIQKYPEDREFNTWDNIMKNLCELDKDNNIFRVRVDLLPYLMKFKERGIELSYYDDMFAAAKYVVDGCGRISEDALQTAVTLGLYTNGYHIIDIIKKCRLEGTCINKDALNAAEEYFIFNKNERNEYDLEYLLSGSVQKDADGKEIFNRELYNKLLDAITKEYNYRDPYALNLRGYDIKDALDAGCDIETLLKYGAYIFKDTDFREITRKLTDYKAMQKLEYDLFKVCTIEPTYSDDKRRITGIDRDVFRKFKELASAEPPVFDITLTPQILGACKEKTYSSLPAKFSPKLVEKAIQLQQAGVEDFRIAGIIEACKINTYYSYTGNWQSEFSDEIFNTVIKTLQNGSPSGIIKDSLIYSKDTFRGEERFNPQNFERLLNCHIVPFESQSKPSARDFYIKRGDYNYKHDQRFDIDLYEKYSKANCRLENICISRKQNDDKKHIPSEQLLDAYIELKNRNITYTKRESDYNSDTPEVILLNQCKKMSDYYHSDYDSDAFRATCELLDMGYDGRDILDVEYGCKGNSGIYYNEFKPKRYDMVKNLLEQGIDINNAGNIAHYCIDDDNNTDAAALNKCLELYNMGVKNPVSALDTTKGDETAYHRLKIAIKRNLPPDLIERCHINKKFNDRLFRFAINLDERNYSPHDIVALIGVCRERDVNLNQSFNYDMYNHIADLEKLGIQKENISTVLSACKSGDRFLPEVYDKISQLYFKQYDDKGIAVLLDKCIYNGKFDEEKYHSLLKLTAKHTVLKDLSHDDKYVINKLCENARSIETTKELFGEDVLNNAVSLKIDNYIQFANQCRKLKENCSESFIKDLQERLNTLPSPELKVKRLRVLGALSDKVDEEALKQLKSLIESPEMTKEQIKLANKIFADKEKPYSERVEEFILEINAPANTKGVLKEYLLKARLDKQIEYPKPIDEQMAQMDEFAQQMLTNPKTPLDKKLKYIDEFKAKKADMQANPEKYTTPKIFPKPLERLKAAVMAHVNIPNADAEFNSSITYTMYRNFGIEVNKDLLDNIHYDAKYFDKLFSAHSDFKNNFKRLIELKKMNIDKPLTQSRLELPEEGSNKYKTYEALGLIEQIKANQDTVRQFRQYGLDFDKWNTYDENLKGETFTVEADPETEYKNSLFNLINIFQDKFFQKINPEETEKLKQSMSSQGYTIYNNKLYKNGSVIENNDLEDFTHKVQRYIENDKYWKSATAGDTTLTEDEITGINAFKDHLNDIANHIKEIRGAKTVNDIYLRLSDDNNIGRNIFFGNHVSCCNSVESRYAGYSAPMHLLNNFNRGLELVDKYGNSYGNSMCFFADIDGKLTFVIDSFEANDKLASNPVVTEEIIKFAKQVCKAMGREDAQIMLGPRYNHIDTSCFKEIEVGNMNILGTVSTETYCDSAGGKNVKEAINNGKKDIKMQICK